MKEQSSMRSWSHKPSSQQKQSGAATAATTRRAKHWLGDVVADTQGEQAGKDQEAPRDSTQKAKYENLMEQVVSEENAQAAWLAVKRNGGAPGIDRMTTGQLRDHIDKHWETLRSKLLGGTYVPSPVKRVEIPKPNGGVRPLGIPTVRDRVVQTALRNVLEPIFERDFAEQSYGFRPKRGCKEALRRVDYLLKAGYTMVVDADLRRYFDTIPKDRLPVTLERLH